MDYSKIYRRKEGFRIKISCDSRFNIKILKAPKGKRFSQVWPVPLSETTIDGYYNNGGGVLDSNNRSVLHFYSTNASDNIAKFINQYCTDEEIKEVKTEMWLMLKP